MRETGLTADQARIGRAALGWSDQDLADAAGIPLQAVIDLEGDVPVSEATARKTAAALALAGVSFFQAPDGSARMRARTLDGIIEAPVTMRVRP